MQDSGKRHGRLIALRSSEGLAGCDESKDRQRRESPSWIESILRISYSGRLSLNSSIVAVGQKSEKAHLYSCPQKNVTVPGRTLVPDSTCWDTQGIEMNDRGHRSQP